MRHLLFLLLLAAAAAADPLRITEVVTDPQADHSENAGGNGTPYDAFPGTGTISTVDELVEVFHAGAEPLDLTGYVLDFLDSSPSQYVFGVTAGGVLRFSAGSSLEALLPGGYVLLGNPPGALNNVVDIELRAPAGGLVDRLAVTAGAATSALDEAVARAWTGTGYLARTRREPISPLGPGPAVPEPGPLLLLGLSALAGAAAMRRRARPAPPRTPAGSPPPPGALRPSRAGDRAANPAVYRPDAA